MLSYTGRGDYFEVDLVVWGDGVGNSVTIDLSKDPFNLNFAPKAPYMAVIRSDASDPGAAVSFVAPSMLTVTFDVPPPLVDPANPVPAGRQLTVRFIYQ